MAANSNGSEAGPTMVYETRNPVVTPKKIGTKDPRTKIWKFLKTPSIQRQFAISGECRCLAMASPGLQLNGFGSIGLPISDREATVLAGEPSGGQAKCFSASQFKINNPEWSKGLENLVSKDLRVLDNVQAEAKLDQLVLCQKGDSFNIIAEDGNLDGLFGKLVITLPSEYDGGEQVVTHGMAKKTVAQSHHAQFKAQYTAFYSNCQYEITQIMSGNCLCVVYNLFQVGSSRPTPRATDIPSTKLQKLQAAVNAWNDQYNGKNLVIMLDQMPDTHRITELLARLAQHNVELAWDNASVSCSRLFIGEHDEECFSCGTYPESDCDNIEWPSKPEEEEYKLCLTTHGSRRSFDVEQEMLPPNFFDGRDPYSEEFTPEGCDCDCESKREYKERAVVLWPLSKTWVMVADDDLQKMISHVKEAISLGTEDVSSCKAKAFYIMKRLAGKEHYGGRYDVSGFIDVLIELGDLRLAEKFIAMYVHERFSDLPKLMPKICHLWESLDIRNDKVEATFLKSITLERVTGRSDTVLAVAVAFWRSKCSRQAETPRRFVEKAIQTISLNKCDLRDRLSNATFQELMQLFMGPQCVPGSSRLALEVLETVVCVSSKWSRSTTRCRDRHTSTVEWLATLAWPGLADLFDQHGWAPFETILQQACSKLLENESKDSAVSFVKTLALPVSNVASERFRICSAISNEVIQNAISPDANISKKSRLELFRLIDAYDPALMATFVEATLSLDLWEELHPLVVGLSEDNSFQSRQADDAFVSINTHCADAMSSALARATVKCWAVSNAWLIPPEIDGARSINNFLRDPCRITFFYAEGAGLMKHVSINTTSALQDLVDAGQIEVNMSRSLRGGVTISKLKPATVPVTEKNLQCGCRLPCTYQDAAEQSRKLNEVAGILSVLRNKRACTSSAGGKSAKKKRKTHDSDFH
jgi:hypothetical protein